jgi:hypothetical protein
VHSWDGLTCMVWPWVGRRVEACSEVTVRRTHHEYAFGRFEDVSRGQQRCNCAGGGLVPMGFVLRVE